MPACKPGEHLDADVVHSGTASQRERLHGAAWIVRQAALVVQVAQRAQRGAVAALQAADLGRSLRLKTHRRPQTALDHHALRRAARLECQLLAQKPRSVIPPPGAARWCAAQESAVCSLEMIAALTTMQCGILFAAAGIPHQP